MEIDETINPDGSTTKQGIVIPAVEMVKVSDLKVDGNNPNVMSKSHLESLKENIKRFGFLVPIITNKDLVVADGEQRLTASKEIGMFEVPVIKLDIKEVDRRIIRQVMNKLKGEHDVDADLLEFQRIIEDNGQEDLNILLDMNEKEMSQILDAIRGTEEDEVPPVPVVAVSKRGEIYQLGNHRLMCGDATSEENVNKLMNGMKADMVFTDPPYNVNYSIKNELLNLMDKGNHIQTPLKNHFLTESQYRFFKVVV